MSDTESSGVFRPPPHDAELIGHWWFEGPQFLDYLFRKMHFDQHTIESLTPFEYLERHPRNQVSVPSFSSWGYKGYAEYWLEGSNYWIYRHLEHAVDNMVELASQHRNSTGLIERTLNQAARELLLAQSRIGRSSSRPGRRCRTP